jgi:hypothetical protein
MRAYDREGDELRAAPVGEDPKRGRHPANELVFMGSCRDSDAWVAELPGSVVLDVERDGAPCGRLSMSELRLYVSLEGALQDRYGAGEFTVRPRGGNQRLRMAKFKIGPPALGVNPYRGDF